MADEFLGTNFGETVEKESYERLVDYCRVRGFNLAGREETLRRLNSYDDPSDGPGPYFIAQDCDGDGLSDIGRAPE